MDSRQHSIKVLIADDHPVFLRGTRQVLEDADGIVVVGEAQTGPQALALVSRTNPDVALLDIRMPGLDGLACLERIRSQHPRVKVVMFSACTAQDQIDAAFRRGAASYIVKSVNPVDLPSAIRQAHQQTVFHAQALPDVLPAAQVDSELTPRELTILRAVARGCANRQISADLWVTEKTVKFHLSNIFRKLDVPNRTAAARYALQHGLVESVVDEPAA